MYQNKQTNWLYCVLNEFRINAREQQKDSKRQPNYFHEYGHFRYPFCRIMNREFAHPGCCWIEPLFWYHWDSCNPYDDLAPVSVPLCCAVVLIHSELRHIAVFWRHNLHSRWSDHSLFFFRTLLSIQGLILELLVENNVSC